MGDCGCNKVQGKMTVSGGCPDVVIDVAGAPYETGFKFNTIPFGGMTIAPNNAVRIGSASDIKLVPPNGATIIIGTTGSPPTASAAYEGALFVALGGGGVADSLQVCLKAAGGGFNWKTIISG